MLEELKKSLKNEKQNKDIFDIVLYGSIVKGKLKPNDIDIVVIFKNGNLKERLEKIQEIKIKIKLEKLDIKGILLEELFKEEFFARSGIFIEGISLFDGKPFSQKIGFQGSSLFIYNLKDKSHNEKVKFNYILAGRNDIGIINSLEGKSVAHGVVEIPIKNTYEFEEILNKHKIKFKKMNVMIQK